MKVYRVGQQLAVNRGFFYVNIYMNIEDVEIVDWKTDEIGFLNNRNGNIYKDDYSDIENENGVQAGVTKQEVLDYLNDILKNYAEVDVSVLNKENTQLLVKSNLDKFKFNGDKLRVEVDGSGSEVTLPDAYFDAFNRLRISNTAQRFDVEFIYDKQDEVMDEVIGGLGTVDHQINTRDLILKNVGSALIDGSAMMSYNIPYTPGNSQLIAITGNVNELNLSGNAEIFFRSKVSGSVVETVYDQSVWSEDSVLDADWSKTQILEIDFQSLKVGRIRFYLNRNGILTPVHNITNDNKYSAGYWQLPTLPLGWRVWNDENFTYTEMCYGDEENGIGLRFKTSLSATQQLRAICGTVKSEGGERLVDITGYNRATDSGLISKSVGNTMIPLISIRQKDLFKTLKNRSLVIPKSIGLTSTNPIKYVVIHGAELVGADWNDVDSGNSSVEFDVSATSFSGGHIMFSDYIMTVGKNKAVNANSLLGKALLWSRRGDMSGIVTIASVRIGGSNSNVYSNLQWKEIR